MMRAALYENYGGSEVIRIDQQHPIPEVREHEILIKVKAAAVNPVDWKIRRGELRLITVGPFPRTLGMDCAGEIVLAGSKATRLMVGQSVFGKLPFRQQGAFAEYAVGPEDAFVTIPRAVSFAEAAAAPLAGMTALQALHKLRTLGRDSRILVIGGSGGVGHYAIQIAKSYGAYVGAVASTRNQQFLHGLGADAAIDYTCQPLSDFKTNFDVIFDAVGKQSFIRCRNLLTRNGIYVTAVPSPESMLWSAVTVFCRKKCKTVFLRYRREDLITLQRLLAEGKLKSHIDRSFSLPELAAAFSYGEQEHTVGKIIITMD